MAFQEDSIQEITITLPDISSSDIYAERVVGTEGLDMLYGFWVSVISNEAIDGEKILGRAAKIKIRVFDEEMKVNGIVTSFRAQDPSASMNRCYEVLIEPEMALMALSSQNQVYGTNEDVSVIDIVANEMSDGNKSGSSTGSSRQARSIQHRMLAAAGDYPTLEFTMQYMESDFNFVSRLCERFGIFYSFDHDGDKETVIFGDRKEHFRKLSGANLTEELSYQNVEETRARGDFYIQSFHSERQARPGGVQLRDYNYATASVDLSVEEKTASKGFGVCVYYDENYKDKSEGTMIAKRRAERFEAEKLIFRGESNIPNIRPGLFFKLVDHPESALEQYYVILEVKHEITQPTPLGFSSASLETKPYRNSLVCMPFDVPYRPALKTKKPIVAGPVIGFVDLDEISDTGCYRVRLMAEESGLSDGKASCWVRKMEAYGGGAGFGTHSVLRKGTEVLLTFERGDPDRPIILGAMSNSTHSSVTDNRDIGIAMRTKTTSGVVFQISDGGE
ncbi:type VI secretion system tip protein TssI/VgrG [uncultured Cohaesibacter sp.]|uniref:type VI secretion system tip protein TssI/VgrG n=1 Tax=uncultured Cohaesibacter sp. TaxID=1002546 RepID=UPI0029C7DFDA|nr:type VI secretion system tip protein TssI/VgrG [uncultured Cohaesibacter sp.]